MNKEPGERLNELLAFTFDEFNDLPITGFVVCRDLKTNEPIINYIKVKGKNWHKYFLDAGLGFLEDLELKTLGDEYDDLYKYQDEIDKYGLRGKIISAIVCEAEGNNSRISIYLKDGSPLILKCKNAEEFDSECEIIKLIKNK